MRWRGGNNDMRNTYRPFCVSDFLQSVAADGTSTRDSWQVWSDCALAGWIKLMGQPIAALAASLVIDGPLQSLSLNRRRSSTSGTAGRCGATMHWRGRASVTLCRPCAACSR